MIRSWIARAIGIVAGAVCCCLFVPTTASARQSGGAAAPAQQAPAALVKAAQNPVANMISLPFQNNTSFGIGSFDRTQTVVNIQPVIPISLGAVNLITRTIIPVVYQPTVNEENGGVTGLGSVSASFFFSPADAGKITWGVGPQVTLNTETDSALGAGKWSAGPAAVVLTMPGHWVIGTLISNQWSVAGDDTRPDVNQFVLQYFVNYNLDHGWYISSAPIISANWEATAGDKWLVPFGGGVGKIFRVGRRPMNAQVQAFWNAVRPDTLPSPSWQLRLQLQLLFPK